jgi:hypothetical protein
MYGAIIRHFSYLPVNRPFKAGGRSHLQTRLRLAFLASAVLLLLLLPVGEASVLAVLFVAVDLGAAALMLDRSAPQPASVVIVGGDDERLDLLRRTVPALRMRRPPETVEAQVRWREAAQIRRQLREIA